MSEEENIAKRWDWWMDKTTSNKLEKVEVGIEEGNILHLPEEEVKIEDLEEVEVEEIKNEKDNIEETKLASVLEDEAN